MSYCVNCGVELAASEKRCPLCSTVVINPSKPWEEPAQMPYPKRVEHVLRLSDRRFGVGLASIVMIIPAIITLISDVFINKSVTWSAYVINAEICLFAWFLLPFLFKKPRPYLWWAIDTAVALVFLCSIAWTSGSWQWLTGIGAPIAFAASVFSLSLIKIMRFHDFPSLYRVAMVSVLVGLLVMAVEWIIKEYLGVAPHIRWSLFALTPCVIVGALFVFFEKRKKLKDEIKRRLFI